MPQKRLYLLLLLLSLAGYFWIFYSMHTLEHKHTSVCVLKNTTGIPCPACGTTRSVVSILNGNLEEAVYLNPLGYLVVGMLLLFPSWILLDLARGTTKFYSFYTTVELFFQKKIIYLSSGTLVLINWIWNINKGL